MTTPPAPGWEKYKRAHEQWYRGQEMAKHASKNHWKFWKEVIRPRWDVLDPRIQNAYHLLQMGDIPARSTPPAAPVRTEPPCAENGFVWPGTIPVPMGALLPPPVAHLTPAQIIAGQPAPVRTAVVQVVINRVAAAQAPLNDRLTAAQSEADRIKLRSAAFDGPDEADVDAVPEIIPRTDLKSKGADYTKPFGPNELDRLVKDWTCNVSNDDENSAKWIPKRFLSKGSFGCATLWLKLDGTPDDRVIDRIVAKDIDYRKSWGLRTAWADDDRTIPIEAATHAAVDLVNLIHSSFYREHEETPIPPKVVWTIFKALVEATIHMHKANVIHLDLHAGNIFMSRTADEDPMHEYGVKPLVADFGLALPINSSRFENPSDFDDIGKESTRAPEQCFTFPSLVEPPPEEEGKCAIDEHTSVFHVGVLMHQILNGFKNPKHSLFEYKDGEEPKDDEDESFWKYRQHNGKLFQGEFYLDVSEDDYLKTLLLSRHKEDDESENEEDDAIAGFYKEQMKPYLDLLKQCLRFQPKDRITLEALLEHIEMKLGEFEDGDEDADKAMFADRVPKRKLEEEIGYISPSKRNRPAVPDADVDDDDEEERPLGTDRTPQRRR